MLLTDSYTYYPFMVCHCITDRKTSGFYNVNISAEAKTFKVEGMEHVKIYRAKVSQIESKNVPTTDGLSSHKRHFCGECGSALWAFDERSVMKN